MCNKDFVDSRRLSLHGKKAHNIDPKDLYELRNPGCAKECMTCHTSLKFIDQEKGYPQLCSGCNRKKAYKDKNISSWNRGLTKDVDERMKRASESMKQHYAAFGHHNTGKNKSNNEDVAKKCIKMSQTLKKKYESQHHWTKGLTKENSEMVAKRCVKISEALRGRILADSTIELLRKRKLLNEEVISQRLRDKQLSLQGEYVDTMVKSNLLCLTCGCEFARTLGSVFNNNAKCPECHPPWAVKTSGWQREVAEFVGSLGVKTQLNDREALGGLEIDVYVPDKNFGIECNGLYWHSEASGRFEKGHAEKKRLASVEKGIKLLTIFDDEWRDKKDIIQSMIKHRLGLSHKIYARNCSVLETNPMDTTEFIKNNHLDGNVRSQYALKLINKDGDIVGAMTLRWAKNGSDKSTLEIARMCFLKNTAIIGGMSKLIKEAKKIAKRLNVQRVLTYSDNRLGGFGYESAGMTLDGETTLRFWWTNGLIRYDRFKFKANKTKNLSEKQVAAENNVFKIYGCTNNRYVMTSHV